jgi:tetratricopeptide (TPR) repeat protein
VRYDTESLALAQEQGDTRLSAGVLQNLGNAARHQGDYRQAAAYYSEKLSLSRALGDEWQVCFALLGLGIVAGEQGNDAQAIALLNEALRMCRDHGDQEGIAECLEELAGCAARQRQGVRAAACLVRRSSCARRSMRRVRQWNGSAIWRWWQRCGPSSMRQRLRKRGGPHAAA